MKWQIGPASTHSDERFSHATPANGASARFHLIVRCVVRDPPRGGCDALHKIADKVRSIVEQIRGAALALLEVEWHGAAELDKQVLGLALEELSRAIVLMCFIRVENGADAQHEFTARRFGFLELVQQADGRVDVR